MPFGFFDWETQSESDLPVTGTLRYVLDSTTRPLLNSWAIDDGPVKLWCPDLSEELAPEVWAYVKGRMAVVGVPPPDFVELLSKPDGYVIAHNAAFDRHVWQQIATPDYGWPKLRIEQVLCNQAQSQASNLPGQLDWAGRVLGLGQKTIGGKAIMYRFARRQEPLPGAKVLIDAAPNRAEAVREAINSWCLYLDYSVQDTELMRAVWKCTRPLDATEWAEYHASERINDRGMLADLDVCAGAVQYRVEESEFVADECKRLTYGAIDRPTLALQINKWLYDQLSDEFRQHMVKERDKETGEPTKLTAGKLVLARILEDIYVSDAPPEDNVVEFIELLQFGRSSSAVKFEKVLNQEVEGRLTNSYVFNGAGQTGRLCLAEGSKVLVCHRDGFGAVEEVPIESVRLSDRVWDGDSWVRHAGVVANGYKEIMSYDGVLATPEHDVFVYGTNGHEKLHLADARAQGRLIVRSWSQPDSEILEGVRYDTNQWPDIRDEKRTYDILNAGPHNRFTVNDRLVSNSSRGVQIHNLPRDKVPNELDVLDMVASRVPIEELRKLPLTKDDTKKQWLSQDDMRKLNIPSNEIRERYRGDTSVNALLARLIRPTFHAPKGKLMVWGDWSAIEARVTPWLANTHDAEETVLRPFRESDADPNVPDVYILNASTVFHVYPDVLWERYRNDDVEAYNMRQGGKVMTLSLAFRGSVGALRAMARGYKIRLSNEEAKVWVDGWRDRNRWNKRYGVTVEEAAFGAMSRPMTLYKAGRLTYQYAPDLMGGTLVCLLPDMRPIVYPMARISKVEKFGKQQDAITYLNGMGRRSLWDGLQIENGTQGLAASILRGTLTRLEDEEDEAETVGDTHDEIICEIDEDRAKSFAERLEATMVRGFDWTEGLPLAAEVKTDWYYHK
jgi:hypothetical protein